MLSILGLYRVRPDIFDGLIAELPRDPDTHEILINSQALVNNILLECAELEILYPEPDTMALAITTWAQIRSDAWSRIYTALVEDYNPLHNYDRHEEIDRTYTPGAGYTDSATEPEYSDTLENPGFNANTLVTASKTSHASKTAGQFTHTPDGESDVDSVDSHMYGNIGVTTAAQMLTGELAVRQNDIYNIITNEFRRRFCLLIY